MYVRNAKLIQEKYREYLIPSVLSSAALAVASLVDSMLVGSLLGEKALAGVGACTPITALGNAMFLLFVIGGATSASVAMGERKTDKANKLYSIGICFGCLVMTVLVLLLELLGAPICYYMCYKDAALAANMLGYYRPLLCVFPVLFLTIGISQFMRIDGRPRMASYIAVAANIVNLICDYCFIRFLNMGVAGASASTLTGYIFGIFMVLPWLLKKDKSFKLVNFWGDLKQLLPEVFSGGSSRFSLSFADFLKRFFLNSIILFYAGNPGLSVLTVCNTLQFFVTSVTNGGSEAFLPIVGSLYGEKDYYGIKECVKSALKFILSGCLIMTVILFVSPSLVGKLFGLNSPDTAEIVPIAFRMLALAYPFMGLSTILQTMYNTTGRHRIASAMSFLGQMVYICFFFTIFGWVNTSLLWAGFPASYLATLATAYIYIKHIQKKENIRGFLLLKDPDEGVIYKNVTIEATKEDAAGISAQIIEKAAELGFDKNKANRLSVAVEELAVTAAENVREGQETPLIDILFTFDGDEKTVSFRENGTPFNPLAGEAEDEEKGSNIQVLKSLVRSVDFSRQLGFNTTILRF
ncbi:MAG: polysaccharide biosynthesis C-terminal domain-containing protein [Lachnospiraceae bacterium]|nr:polysaccharide biosynthesis C-terminal domain-containing protein [Lachnospiraceae bacterium]